VKLTDVCPARVATSSGPAPAAIHRATAVCRRSWSDLGIPATPSATVAILQEQPEAIDWLVLGDTTLLLEGPTGLQTLTDDRLEHVAAGQHRAMRHHATGSADHDRSLADLVTEQRRHRNHPDGFWVASIDPTAAQQP